MCIVQDLKKGRKMGMKKWGRIRVKKRIQNVPNVPVYTFQILIIFNDT